MAFGKVKLMRKRILFLFLPLIIASMALAMLLGGMISSKGGLYKYLGLFSDVLTIIMKEYVDPISSNLLLEGANRGLLSSLDPNSAYLTKEEVIEFKNLAEGGEASPGLECLKAHGYLTVVSVYEGSAAEKVGISPGDQILAINGKSVRNLSLLQCQELMEGDAGSELRLSLIRMRAFHKEDVSILREKIKHPGFKLSLQRNRIAHLRIYDMKRVDPVSLQNALKEVEEKSHIMLIDLRNSTRGDYIKAVKLASLFIDRGTVFIMEKRGTEKKVLEAFPKGFAWKKPVFVLISSGTAGPSEGLALFLKERVGATVIGERSYGMGLEAELITFEDGSGILLSTIRYISPSGISWNRTGITPSLEIRSDAKEEGKEKDDQLQKALDYVLKEGAVILKKAA
ncbi:MAG: S41 family peptidase [Acidobacteriota bacterium]